MRFPVPWAGLAAALITAAIVGGAVALLKSLDDGDGTDPGVLDSRDFHSLAFDPVDSDVVLFGHHDGLLRSVDGGSNWSPLVDQRDFDAMGVAVNPNNPRQFYIAGHNDLHVTEDGGQSWRRVEHNLPGTDIHALTMSPDDPLRLYAFVVGMGVWVSEDGGSTFTALPAQLDGDLIALKAAGGSPETIYVSPIRGGVYRSDDGGESWQATALDEGLVFSLAVDPTDPQTVYAAANEGLYKSVDSGATWAKVELTVEYVGVLAVAPDNPSTLLAVGIREGEGIVLRSEDAGETWADLSEA